MPNRAAELAADDPQPVFFRRAAVGISIGLVAAVVPLTAPAAPAVPTTSASPAAPTPPRFAFGLSAGVGTQYGDLGAQLVGVVPFGSSPWSVFAGVGVGGNRAPEEWETFDERVPWKLAPVFVAGGSLGRRHRLSVAIGYGRVALQPVVIQGAVVDAATVHGAFGEIGYEYVHPSGFVFRAFPAGITRTTDAFYVGATQENDYSLSFGVGWRTR